MVYFITIAALKEVSYINSNVDDEQLKIIIQRVQNIHLAEMLNNTFYDHLATAISGSSLTAKETTLISTYLQPYIVCLSEIKATVFLKTQLRKKTVGQNNDEFMTSNSKELLNDLNSEKVVFENNIKKFLNDNQNDFPLYFNNTECDVDRVFNVNINFI